MSIRRLRCHLEAEGMSSYLEGMYSGYTRYSFHARCASNYCQQPNSIDEDLFSHQEQTW